jgi:hypothetical protein
MARFMNTCHVQHEADLGLQLQLLCQDLELLLKLTDNVLKGKVVVRNLLHYA